MNATENRGGEAHINNDNTNNAGGNFQRAIVPIQDVSEILSKYDFKEKIGTGGKTTIYDYPAVPSRLLILVSVVDFFPKTQFFLFSSLRNYLNTGFATVMRAIEKDTGAEVAIKVRNE